VYIIGGVGGAFLNSSIYQLLFLRALVGLGAGLSASISGAIVASLYEGQARASMLGWCNAFGNVIAAAMTLVAGALALIKWEDTFLAYTLFLFVLILEIFALPSLPPERASQEDADAVEKLHYTVQQKVKLFALGLYTLSCITVIFVMFIKVAIFVNDERIGNALIAASALSANNIVGFVTATFFGFINQICKRYTLVLCTACAALSFFILLNAHSASMVIAAGCVAGVGAGLFIPALQLNAVAIGPKVNATYAMSVVMGAIFLGGFMSTFVEKIPGLSSPRASFSFAALCLVVFTVAYLVWILTHPEKNIPADRVLADSKPLQTL
jgi:predicted MFS family arabinose efflux permease